MQNVPLRNFLWLACITFLTVSASQAQTAPNISSLSPTSGPIGTPVTITGTNFGATQGSVTIGGATASITNWSSTTIVAVVPSSLAVGTANVVVAISGQPPSNSVGFSVTPGITTLS